MYIVPVTRAGKTESIESVSGTCVMGITQTQRHLAQTNMYAGQVFTDIRATVITLLTRQSYRLRHKSQTWLDV